MDAIAWQLLLLELALVVLLAVLSAGEAAINIVRRPGMAEELDVRGRRGKRAGAIGRRAGYYLASIQVAEFLIVFTYAGIAAAFIAPRLSALLAFFLGIDTTAIFTDVSAVAVTVAVLSLIAVLFGLFVPRAIAARHAQGTLLLLAFPLELITWITRPIVTVLFRLTQVIVRPFGGTAPQPGVVTEDQIRALIETGQAQGVLERKEQEMISSIFEMGDKTVADVMVPRTDIVGLDVNTTAQELLDRITTVGHSRIPVYEGSADNIIGILYVKDVFRRIARGDRQLELRQFLRPAVFVPETKKVDELLREMQKGKVHIAIVVDEYGGTAGLVTIEDLVEEIVGEIRDEYDVEHELVLPVSENEALMDARIPFEEVRETFGLEVRPTEAYETLGGFVTAQLGRFPRQGESFEAAGARFVVETIDGKRIRRVRVTRLQPSPEPA
jgi:putative hemolysin